MRRILLSLPFLLLTSLFALPALAGNWGENWGTLTWGAAIAAVPTMGKLGVLVLALGLGGLAARFIQRSRSAASLLVIGLVLPMGSPVANADTVSVPNTFVNGTSADADQMNANFDAVEAAVNANASAITGAQSTADAAASSATSAQGAAAAAQSTASGAVSDAAAAQSTASGAVSDAAAAQSTASGAVSDAAAAQSTAGGAASAAASALTDAAAAQSTADAAEAQIAALQVQMASLVRRFRFEACVDGVTVADLATGLLWERKTSDGSVHDTANSYSWSTTGTAADGTAYSVFLPALNTSAFAGHSNWRLPVISELQSIMVGPGVTTTSTNVDPPDPAMGTNVTGQSTTCSTIPCLDPRFALVAGPTPPLFNLAYWSAQSRASSPPINAWAAGLEQGTVSNLNSKLTPLRVRAVRAGSCD